MKKPCVDPEVWRDVLDAAMSAYGAALDLGQKHPACAALYEALDVVETAFCRDNRDAYREWAADQAAMLQKPVLPCDAWYEGRFKKSAYRWIDET